MKKTEPITENLKDVEIFLGNLTKMYIQYMIMYGVFTLYWMWRKVWIIVGIHYMLMFYFTYSYQKEKWIYRYWKELKVYKGFNLKRAGEV